MSVWDAVSLVILVVALVLSLFAFLHRRPDFRVTGVDLVVVDGAQVGCDTTVDLTGTIGTDGTAGTVDYQWLRGDGQSSEVLHEHLSANQRSVVVHFRWTFTGKGSYQAHVTLQVLAPQPAHASATFGYACS